MPSRDEAQQQTYREAWRLWHRSALLLEDLEGLIAESTRLLAESHELLPPKDPPDVPEP